MTDEVVTRQKAQVATPAELAAAREARGMSQIDISHRIKLQIKQVNALEQGQWEALPGRSFVRGALRSYGRLLGVDVAPLLESIGGFAEPALAPVLGSQPLEATLSRSSGMGFNGGGRGSPLVWVIACLAGVVGLVLYFGSDQDASRFRPWLPSDDKSSGAAADPAPADPAAGGVLAPGAPAADPAGGASAGAPVAGSAAGAPTGGAAGAPTTGSGSPSALSALQVLPNKSPGAAPPPVSGAPAGAGATAAGSTVVPGPGHATPGTAPGAPSLPAAPASGSKGAAAVAATEGNPASASSSGSLGAPGKDAARDGAKDGAKDGAAAADNRKLIQFKALEDSWVEVRQADGTALHNGLVKAGSSIELKGSNPPYRLVIGNASRLELTYGGKAQDLAPHIRAHNIAKLQLP